MKILVPVKRVVDYNVKVRVKSDQTGVELDNVKMAMNPFDEIAVEESLRIKEANKATEVIICSIGPTQCQETIRTGLAMGADRGLFVEEKQDIEPINVAKILAYLVNKEKPNLVLCGKQAIDDDCNQTGQMLSALLGWSQATFASQIEINDGSANVIREVDGGLEHLKVSLPSVISVDLRLNEPRYASLPNIMKAKRKPIDVISVSETDIDTTKRLRVLKVEEPETRKAGVILNSVDELIQKLKNDEKVI